MFYPNNTYNRELGTLIFVKVIRSLGYIIPFGIFFTFIFICLFVCLDIAFIEWVVDDVRRSENQERIFENIIILSLVFSFVVFVLFRHYCTRHYVYFYENGFIDVKWNKRVIMYDQISFTWLEEDCVHNNTTRSNVIITEISKKYKKYIFSIFSNKTIGADETVFVLTFDDLNHAKETAYYKTVLDRIIANTTSSKSRDTDSRLLIKGSGKGFRLH
jgi:hypothetical protein